MYLQCNLRNLTHKRIYKVMSPIHYIMVEGYTNIMENINDRPRQALMRTSIEQSQNYYPRT